MKDILIFASKKITILTGSKCCQKCGSSQIVKNGSNSSDNPKHKCKLCGFSGVFQTVRKSEAFKEMVIQAAQERSSARGLGKIFGISYQNSPEMD